jgi:Na+/melibiose symporter-like transporter
MSALGWIVLISLPLSGALLVMLVPEPKAPAAGLVSWRRGLVVAAQNAPFMRLLATNFLGRIGTAANLAVVVWFFEKGLDLGEAAGIPLVVYLVTAVAGAPLWIWAGHVIPKHNALIAASLGGITVFGVLFFVPQHELVLTTAIMAIAGIAGSAAATLGASIGADVIDLDTLRSGEARAGLLIAFWSMAQKGADALGVGLGLLLLSAFAFDPNGANDAHAVLGLKIVYIAMPIAFWLASAIFIWRFPITPERQRLIRKALERRAKRNGSASERS